MTEATPLYTFIWSAGAIADHQAGKETKRLLRHRISNVVSPAAADAFVRQIRRGTPYRLIDKNGGIVYKGTA